MVFVLGVDSLSSTIATSHRWLFKSRLTIIKTKINAQFLVALAIFQVLSNHLWLVTLVMDSADVDSFHHCRKFIWTTRVQRKSGANTWCGMVKIVQVCTGSAEA